MILSETLFVGGEPVGVIRQDTNTGQIAFSPIRGQSELPVQDWASIDDLKASVLSVYAIERPEQNHG